MTRGHQTRRDDIGVYVLVISVTLACGIAATFGLGRVFRSMEDAGVGSAARPSYVPAPDPIARAEAGLLPDSTDTMPGEASEAIRTIQVFPELIYLTAGGRITRQIELGTPVGSLLDIVNVVNDTAWISNDGGVVTLSAGLILEPRTSVTISSPISMLIMKVKPGVYLGATGASLSIRGVTVQAGDNKVPRDGEVGDGARPFVVASDLSRMDIANSHFLYLGRDWNASYGVSWVRGSTGSARETTFEKSFIGAFTANARDISFLKNTFRDNVLYGLDPHTSTTGLNVEENLAVGNGHHGIIFSDHVTNSVIRHNTVRNNKINGIMMDYSSDQNLIEGNRVVGNRGDGIVMSDSAQNRVIGNQIDNNRVGVHVYGQILRPNEFQRNTVTDNVAAAQGADLAADNAVRRNGNHWKPLAVGVTWVLTVLAGVLLCLLTRRSRRQRVLQVDRYNAQVRRVKVGAS